MRKLKDSIILHIVFSICWCLDHLFPGISYDGSTQGAAMSRTYKHGNTDNTNRNSRSDGRRRSSASSKE